MKNKRWCFFVIVMLFLALVSACSNPFYSDKKDKDDKTEEEDPAGTSYAPSENTGDAGYYFVFPGNLS